MKRPEVIAISAIESAIRATGARVTTSRTRVLGFLQSARQPLSHGDLEALTSNDGLPGIDRVTLYRVLDWAADAGLAHKAVDWQGVFRFSAANPNDKHALHTHFRCTGCGGVFCLQAPPPPPPTLPRGFRLGGMALDIRGECPHCVRSHS